MTKLLSIVGAIVLGAFGMWYFAMKSSPPPASQSPLMSLEQMGQLVSVKVNYADVIEFAEKIAQDIPFTQWELRFGATKVLLVARGDCLVGTDFRLAKYKDVNQSLRTAVLELSKPKPISARVSHASRANGGSYFYEVTGSGIATILQVSARRTKAMNAALIQAQQEIDRFCGGADVIVVARKNTEAIVLPLFSAIGWKVTVRWTP